MTKTSKEDIVEVPNTTDVKLELELILPFSITKYL